jgi:hypothetical protein
MRTTPNDSHFKCDTKSLVPVVPTVDLATGEDVRDFLAAWAKGHRVDRDGAHSRLVLTDGWTLPIPIVRSGGGWPFDVPAGASGATARPPAVLNPRPK